MNAPDGGPVRLGATVRFVQKDGTAGNEPYRFVVTTDGSGRLILDRFNRA